GRRSGGGAAGAHADPHRGGGDLSVLIAGWSTLPVGHRTEPRCKPYRRPEKRRPPYQSGARHVDRPRRVVNATRWPPVEASVPLAAAVGKMPAALLRPALGQPLQ